MHACYYAYLSFLNQIEIMQIIKFITTQDIRITYIITNGFCFLFVRFLHLIARLGQLPETRDASILADVKSEHVF